MQEGNTIVVSGYGLDIERIFNAILELVLGSPERVDGVFQFFGTLWTIYAVFAFILSALFLFGIIYSIIRRGELAELRDHALHELEHHFEEHHHSSKNERWEQASHHIESDNPNDWRLAIIEADIMLEEALDALGYAGITIGDKLKQASPQFFTTLDDAWKAHRVRNEIAHRGSDFVLTKRLAKETIEQYRRVFTELHII
ncbi:hypothetical protein K2X96_04135 [Patescibacteria group bacterium]|nr:hypothetical protein [Patescibacteria group bacterium]